MIEEPPKVEEKVREVRVTSWAALQEQLFEDAWQEDLRRFRSHYAFRGMGRAGRDLSTSLMRLGGTYTRLERPLLRTFRKYARRYTEVDDSVWNWLAVAQHHGLPTRLLDWTYSPYVALHFATEEMEDYDLDGVVWAVDYVKAHTLVPAPLREILRQEGADIFTTEMLGAVASTLAELDELGKEGFVLFLEPPSLDERIINQYALFSLTAPADLSFSTWLADHPDFCRKIVIPAELKWEVRDKLDQANLTERVLYPGLDGLSRWLQRYYTPRMCESDKDEG